MNIVLMKLWYHYYKLALQSKLAKLIRVDWKSLDKLCKSKDVTEDDLEQKRLINGKRILGKLFEK